MAELSHINENGEASMVDVSPKEKTARRALVRAEVHMRPDVVDMILDSAGPKGDVLPVARVAAIQAAKRTSDLIPLCHPLAITNIKVNFETDRDAGIVSLLVEVKTTDRTGVEMEAMTGASVGALTVYDMCKAVQKDIAIGPIVLLEKDGGKSGPFRREG